MERQNIRFELGLLRNEVSAVSLHVGYIYKI